MTGAALLALAAALAAAAPWVPAVAAPTATPAAPPASVAAPTRGALLYETHCIGCHTTQMHWRDRRVVRDWASLVDQVAQWSERERLGWAEADVLAVAQYLNETIYQLPTRERRAQVAPAPTRRAAAKD
jgi:cytochrome c5